MLASLIAPVWVALLTGCSHTLPHALQPAAAGSAALLREAELNLALGHALRARQQLQRAAAAAPLNLEARLTLAASLAAEGKTAEAETELRGCGADHPKASEPRVALARLLVAAGRVEEACQQYEAARQLSPDDPQLVVDSAATLSQLQQTAQAERLIRAFCTQHPGDLACLSALARLLYQQGRAAEVLPLLRRAAEASVQSPEAWTELGAWYQQTGHPDEAQEAYQEALRIAGNYTSALNNLAYLWLEQGTRLSDAQRLAAIAVALSPGNGHCLDTLGQVLLRRGRTTAAINTLEQARGLLPHSPTITYHLASAYARHGAPKAARQLLKQALQSSQAFGERQACQVLLARLQDRAQRKDGS